MNLHDIVVGIVYNVYEPVAGRSNESISETSVQKAANDVFDAVRQSGIPAHLIPMDHNLFALIDKIKQERIAALINLCEGFRGVPQLESHIAAFFELMDLPFTGNSARTLALCQQKFASKAILQAYALPCARGFLAEPGTSFPDISYPVIVKPNAEDASLGIYADSVVHDQASLMRQVDKINATYQQPALVEEYINGREFNVAVMENETGLVALPVSEIDFSAVPESMPHILSYEAKWFEEHVLYRATVPVCPARIPDTLNRELQSLAVSAFKAMSCRDYARIDFRVTHDNHVFILEVNPNPDISLNAGYARALKAGAIPYNKFWEIMLANLQKRGPIQ